MKTNAKIKISILFFLSLVVTSCSQKAEKPPQISNTTAAVAVKKDSAACCASGIPSRFSAKSQFVEAARTK